MRNFPVVILFLLSALCASVPFVSSAQSYLKGKVKVVDAFPDYKVKVVDAFPDVKVKVVNHTPCHDGEWKFVDAFPGLGQVVILDDGVSVSSARPRRSPPGR